MLAGAEVHVESSGLPSRLVSLAQPCDVDTVDRTAVAPDQGRSRSQCEQRFRLVRHSVHKRDCRSQGLGERLDRHAEVRQHL